MQLMRSCRDTCPGWLVVESLNHSRWVLLNMHRLRLGIMKPV